MLRITLTALACLGILAGCAGIDPRDAPGTGKQSPNYPGKRPIEQSE